MAKKKKRKKFPPPPPTPAQPHEYEEFHRYLMDLLDPQLGVLGNESKHLHEAIEAVKKEHDARSKRNTNLYSLVPVFGASGFMGSYSYTWLILAPANDQELRHPVTIGKYDPFHSGTVFADPELAADLVVALNHARHMRAFAIGLPTSEPSPPKEKF